MMIRSLSRLLYLTTLASRALLSHHHHVKRIKPPPVEASSSIFSGGFLHYSLWGMAFFLPVVYLLLLMKAGASLRFRDNLTLINAMVLFPLAWVITQIVGNDVINHISILQGIVGIINLLDLWVMISMLILSWKFKRPGLVVSAMMFFALLVNKDRFIQNNLLIILFALMSFSIGFSEKLSEIGWSMLVNRS